MNGLERDRQRAVLFVAKWRADQRERFERELARLEDDRGLRPQVCRRSVPGVSGAPRTARPGSPSAGYSENRSYRAGGRASADDPVQVPAVRHALQLVLSRVLEDQTASGDEVLHRLGDKDLRRRCPGADP